MPTKKDFQIRVDLDIQGHWHERPLDFLAELTRCTQGLVQELEGTAVAMARTRGHTWDEIGQALGVSRQAAWGRFASDE